VAPIALYPDTLLGQILIAATYPLEVVAADRWLQDPAHAALKGDQLVAALQAVDWDPSVKSLVPFPRILQMMDSRLDWMQAIGDAFLAQQADVMDSVQRLRQRAQAAGTLQSTPHEAVETDGQAITIAPADQTVVYVPVYSPAVVYAPWPWPDYPPFWFPAPLGFDFYGEPVLWWDVPVVLPLWGWCRWHWHDHGLFIEPGRFHGDHSRYPQTAAGPWQHDPGHRRGVPYRDAATGARFGRAPAAAPAAPRVFRGYENPGEGRSGVRQAPESRPGAPHAAQPSPPLFESYGAGRDVRGDAARGRASGAAMSPHSSGGGRPHR